MNYKNKYLKYKNKYLDYKNKLQIKQLRGGSDQAYPCIDK